MNRSRIFAVTATIILTAATGIAGCGSKQKAAEAPRATTSAPAKTSKGNKSDSVQSRAVHDDGREVALATVFFDYDSDELTPQARDTLAGNARYLEKHRDVTVQIEGHCDERGTSEYNIALGERRAQAARTYMTRLGVSQSRIEVISYGKERPAVRGTGEDVWAQNRRGEFKAR